MKNKRTLGILTALSIILLAVGGGTMAFEYAKRAAAQREYEILAQEAKASAKRETERPKEAKRDAVSQAAAGEFRETQRENVRSETETQAYESPVDFEKLRKINPDIVGWLKIEDTGIDYPIVQTGNNETYLNTDFEGKKSAAGSIYLDYESESDFSGRHNIIYGHNMKNGSMFKDIVKYKEEDYFKAHQTITVYTPEREYHLQPISVLYTDPSGIRRKTRFATEESFLAYAEEMTKGCAFRRMPEKPVSQLWSFITCSYEFNDARTILYACEVQEK